MDCPSLFEAAWKAMTIRGAVLLADKQMPVTKRIVNTSNLPALDNLEWVNVGHPLLVSNELQHPPLSECCE